MPTVEAGTARATISAQDGGRVASLAVNGLELLITEGPTPRRWGAFPMAPWAGRIRHGELHFKGQTYHFPLTNPPHGIHGTVYDRAWRDDGNGSISIDLGELWPFPGRAVHRFRIELDALHLRLEVHADREPMPASCGWHPWWRRQLDRGETAQLDFEAASMYVKDEEGIPTGKLTAPPPGPWDDCFTNVTRWPVITWPGALELRIESSCTHLVVFNQLDHAICVEPQTAAPDAVNANPTIVEPGKPLIAETTWRWRLL